MFVLSRLIVLFFIGVLVSCHSVRKVDDDTRSAAMKRFRGNDSDNELYTRFRYMPVKGLGYEKGVHRRDPSSIIK